MNAATFQKPGLHPATLLVVAISAVLFGGLDSQAQSTSKQLDAPDKTSLDSENRGNFVPAVSVSNTVHGESIDSLSKSLELSESASQSQNESSSAIAGEAAGFRERNDARIDSIHERIHLIRQLIEQDKAKADSFLRDVSSEAEAATNIDQLDLTTEMLNTDTADNRDQRSGIKPEMPSQAMPTEDDSPAMTDESNKVIPIANVADWGTRIVTEPVDSFELAASLFMTGNYEASRKTCEARLKSDIDADEEKWLRCLIGCCQRSMGDYADAEASFRDLTNRRQKSYPVDYAGWNLKYIRQRQEIRDRFQAVSAEIDAMTETQEQP